MPISELDRKHVLHPFSVLGRHAEDGPRRMIVSGEGSTLRDEDGKTYIDAMAGLWCVNVGYGRAEIADALRAQALKLSYYHSFSSMATAPPAELAERLLSLAPAGMSKVFFGSGGSDANDTQIKLVRLYNHLLGRPQKQKVIARDRGYHGVTLGAASLTGLPGMHTGFGLPLPGILHTRAPHRLWEALPGEDDAAFSARLAAELEQQILAEGPETVAAFIAEPVQAAGGVIVPPDGYFEAIQAVLRRHDVLMIADEVVCAFGRLGHWFGSARLGIEPDLITVAKGITSAYVPLSACIVSERVWRVLADRADGAAFSHGYTYSSHPLGAAAALANLDLVEREGLVERAELMGERLRAALRAAVGDHPYVAEIRGIGLLAGVELTAETDPPVAVAPLGSVATEVNDECLARGVISRVLPASDTLAFSPPFVITDEEIETIAAVLREALDAVARRRANATA